jgi:rubrerythrin
LAVDLHLSIDTMNELGEMLERCRALEEQAAALYRRFAVGARHQPELCALWTSLAREETEHAQAVARAQLLLVPPAGWRTRVDGWDEALGEVAARLAAANRLDPATTPDRQLSAALELELSELEGFRHVLLAAAGQPEVLPAPQAHAEQLAHAATHLSSDPQVHLQAAVLLARSRMHEVARGGTAPRAWLH